MRLIDADALLDFLDVGHLRPPTEICFSELMMKNIIDIQPTVDAVPIIRCRECRWGKEDDGSIECHVDLNIPSEYHGYDWYCPSGERKADDER